MGGDLVQALHSEQIELAFKPEMQVTRIPPDVSFSRGPLSYQSSYRFKDQVLQVKPRLSIRDFHAGLSETGSPARAHQPSNQCRRCRATAKRSVGMSGVTLGFSQNAPTASTL